jgi:hypothetical protein
MNINLIELLANSLQASVEVFDKTSIQIFGIKILEPIDSITDIFVTIACLWAFIKISKTGRKEKTFLFFRMYFIIMGIATLLGGLIGHAFLYKFSYVWKLPGWITSMFSIMFVERASIEHTRLVFKPLVIKILGVINILELLTFITLTSYFLDFGFVEFHSGYGLMFVVLSLQTYLFYKNRNQASKTIIIGIIIAAIAALIYMNELSIHRWFNHLALSHTLMAVGAVVICKGVLKIDMEKEIKKLSN